MEKILIWIARELGKIRARWSVLILIKLSCHKGDWKTATQALTAAAATDALVSIGNPAVKPLIESMKFYDPDSIFSGAKALGRIGNKEAVEPLIHLLGMVNKSHKDSQARVIGFSNMSPGSGPGVHQLDAKKMIAIAEALAKIGDKRALDILGNTPELPEVVEAIKQLEEN